MFKKMTRKIFKVVFVAALLVIGIAKVSAYTQATGHNGLNRSGDVVMYAYFYAEGVSTSTSGRVDNMYYVKSSSFPNYFINESKWKSAYPQG
ncbi:hypothetical protein RyT2_13400 [Pseudolactococcus yaeyamensis]